MSKKMGDKRETIGCQTKIFLTWSKMTLCQTNFNHRTLLSCGFALPKYLYLGFESIENEPAFTTKIVTDCAMQLFLISVQSDMGFGPVVGQWKDGRTMQEVYRNSTDCMSLKVPFCVLRYCVNLCLVSQKPTEHM